MPNFSVQIPGEAEPRSFRFDLAEKCLFTDIDTEDPLGGMAIQKEAKITEASAKLDPRHELYWVQTYTHREAYRICEEDGVSLEAAFASVNPHPSVPVPERAAEPAGRARQTAPIDVPEPAAATNPIAGVLITNQQLILEIAFQLLVQYVAEDDQNYQLLKLLQKKVQEFNEYEIII